MRGQSTHEQQHALGKQQGGVIAAHMQACLADVGAARQHDVLQLAQAPQRQDALIGDLGQGDEVQPL